MGFYAVMILGRNDEPHPRHEFCTYAKDEAEAKQKAKMYIEAWEMEDTKIVGCRKPSAEEKDEMLNDRLHYLAEGYKKYQETPKELG